MGSEKRFGYEWNKYNAMDSNYEIQFRKWINPLKLEDFKNKRVLDAGCGMGRNSYWSLKYGAKELVAFDFDERSVAATKKTLFCFDNASVNFKSIYEILWQDKFDIVFCIGVIHHLKNPKKAINNLIKAIKPGGKILIWVYGYKGNEWIVKLVSPVRKVITSKLPLWLVHFLSYFISIPLWFLVKIFKGPGLYLGQLSNFKFWHIHSIVFDQLIPKVANYWTKQEVLNLFKDFNNLKNIEIYSVNNNSWTILGEKK